jgi:hypothetical protein
VNCSGISGNHSVTIPAGPSYKDADMVMVAQSDLVEIVHMLNQVLNVKGDK